jgi:O-antigen/teichoic acid export membrane protein
VLGVGNIGILRFVITTVGYFSLFASFGIGYYGIRELAKYKNNQEKCSQIFSSLLIITICSTLIVTLLFLLCINLIPVFKENLLLFLLYGITLYFVPITMDWYFQAKENFRMITIRSFVVKLLAFSCLFFFVRKRSDVIPYILISTLSTVITQVWNFIYAFNNGLRINLHTLELRQHIKPMFIFLLSNISIGVFSMIDTMMLGFLSFYEQVGYYTSSNIILTTLISIFAATHTVLFPRLSFNNSQDKSVDNVLLLQKIFDLNVLLVIPMAIGLCLISSRFMPLFYGSEFIGSIIPMQILSFKLIIVILNYFFGYSILIAFGYERKYLVTVVCAAIISIALNFFLIPRYGAIGAALTAVISEGFSAGLVIFFVYKFTRIHIFYNTIFMSLLFSLLPFLAIYYIFDKIIIHNFLFLCIFIFLSIVVYSMLQLMFKNYLLQQIINIIINKLNCKQLKK